MEIVPIFAGQDLETEGGLFAFAYEQGVGNAWAQLYNKWTDPEWLKQYFVANKAYLDDPFWRGLSIENAVLKVQDEADELAWFFDELDAASFKKEGGILQNLFQPLDDRETNLYVLQQQKAKVTPRHLQPPMLRLYAIRVHENLFVITGGAIKLTKYMDEHPDTQAELDKFKKALKFLKNKEISCADDLNELL